MGTAPSVGVTSSWVSRFAMWLAVVHVHLHFHVELNASLLPSKHMRVLGEIEENCSGIPHRIYSLYVCE